MMNGFLRANGDVFLIIRAVGLQYESLAGEWEAIAPNHKAFRDDYKIYFCETIEDAVLIENKKPKKKK